MVAIAKPAPLTGEDQKTMNFPPETNEFNQGITAQIWAHCIGAYYTWLQVSSLLVTMNEQLQKSVICVYLSENNLKLKTRPNNKLKADVVMVDDQRNLVGQL